MSQRDDDLKMLDELFGENLQSVSDRDSLTATEFEAFASMSFDLQQRPPMHGQLTAKQRAWLTAVHERVTGGGYKNLVSSGAIPTPKKPGEPGYVALMVGALPKKPPPMPKQAVPQRASQEHRPFRVVGLDEKDDDT